jgi:bifunctional DNA-binding transcriptional regulator/antitoxin component of YhaV-PrlF toxin-antitoxin module
VVAIPKRLREKLPIAKGQRFLVKVDSEGRLIYEPLKG